MIIRLYRIGGQTGQKQIAQNTALSLSSISYRPEGAKYFCFYLQGDSCISFTKVNALGYALIATLGRFGLLRINH